MVGLVSSIIINPQVAGAILLSGVAFSSRLFFNYSQEQESIADSYALRYSPFYNTPNEIRHVFMAIYRPVAYYDLFGLL